MTAVYSIDAVGQGWGLQHNVWPDKSLQERQNGQVLKVLRRQRKADVYNAQ